MNVFYATCGVKHIHSVNKGYKEIVDLLNFFEDADFHTFLLNNFKKEFSRNSRYAFHVLLYFWWIKGVLIV